MMTHNEQWLTLAMRCEVSKKPDSSIESRIFALVTPRFRDGRFTHSVEAAISLIETELPDSAVLTGKGKTRNAEPLYGAVIYDRLYSQGRKELGTGEAESWPLALCAAFCRAMAARAS